VEIISSSVDKEPSHSVKFTPYRGEIEPIRQMHRAAINFYADFIEVILDYEYLQVSHNEKTDEHVRFAEILPRGCFSVTLASISHVDALDDEKVPCVFISMVRDAQTALRCKSQREAEYVYEEIKKWMTS